jgi:hypothetical protein
MPTVTLLAPVVWAMFLSLGRDHLALALAAAVLFVLWPGGSVAPLAEAGLYIAPLALFVGSLAVADRLDGRQADR